MRRALHTPQHNLLQRALAWSRTIWFVDERRAMANHAGMIVEYIRYEVEDAAALTLAYEEARRSLDASEHCLAYELSRCTEEPTWLILRIEWDSSEGHLAGFRKSPQFGPFLQAVRPFLGQIREMRHYEVTPVVSRKR